jgi:hypothetical protein
VVRSVSSRATWWQLVGGGKATWMLSPPPGRGRAVMVAPWAVAMALTVDRPRPWPLWWVRPGSRRWNGWKSRSTSPPGMSGPVFVTVSMALPSVTAVATQTWPPVTLWAVALSTRFATRLSESRVPVEGGGAERRLDVHRNLPYSTRWLHSGGVRCLAGCSGYQCQTETAPGPPRWEGRYDEVMGGRCRGGRRSQRSPPGVDEGFVDVGVVLGVARGPVEAANDAVADLVGGDVVEEAA